VKTGETKNGIGKNEKDVEGLKEPAGSVGRSETQEEKEVSQKQLFAESLLADAKKVLDDEKSVVFVSGVMAGMELLKNKAQNLKNEEVEEEGSRVERSLKFTVEHIEEILNGFQPDFQKAVLKFVMERQPERDKLAEEENRRQEATDGLHEIIDNWDTGKVESLCRLLEDESLEEKLQLQVARKKV